MSALRRAPLTALAALALAHCIFRAAAPTRPRPTRDGPPRWMTLRDARDAGVADGGAPAPTVAARPPSPDLLRCPDDARYIPGGSFTMGATADDAPPDERPAHEVSLSDYCLDRTEVSSGAYTRCVAAGACTRPATQSPVEEAPVTGVDWNQSERYCRFVGGRLPTEAEWEFAARGTDGRLFPWGNEPPGDCERIDWTVSGASCRGVGASPVGTYPRGESPYGVLDLSGNVWEWTADWYARSYEGAQAQDPTGPEQGSARVTRGGGWNNDQPDRLRSTFREGQHPAFHDYDLGFRCAYDPAR
ncbi:MAG: SUMF1/EgtB/PvdO family nonheme iron enzyme [Polyangiales bacterium]